MLLRSFSLSHCVLYSILFCFPFRFCRCSYYPLLRDLYSLDVTPVTPTPTPSGGASSLQSASSVAALLFAAVVATLTVA